MLHNNGAAGYGGMLTFVTAGTGTTDTGPDDERDHADAQSDQRNGTVTAHCDGQ